MFVPVPSQLGYAAVGALVLGESAGVPLPGETAPITASGHAAAGHLSLPLVVLVTGLAAIGGDTVGYWLGRPARALLLRDGIGAAHRHHAVARANRFFARYGLATAFAGRWVPGVRIVAAATAGAALMPWRRFGVANAAGASARAVTIATLAALAGPIGAVVVAIGGLALRDRPRCRVALAPAQPALRAERDAPAGEAGDDTAATDCPDVHVAARVAARG